MWPLLVDSFTAVPFAPISLLLIIGAILISALVSGLYGVFSEQPDLRYLPSLMSRNVSAVLTEAPALLKFEFWLKFLCGFLTQSRSFQVIQIPLSSPICSRTHFPLESIKVRNCRNSIILVTSRTDAPLLRFTHFLFIRFFCSEHQTDLYWLDLVGQTTTDNASESQMLKKLKRSSQLLSDIINYIRVNSRKPIYAVALGSDSTEQLLFYLCDKGASSKLKAAALLYPKAEINKRSAETLNNFRKPSKTVRFEDNYTINDNEQIGETDIWNQVKPAWKYLLNNADDIAVPVLIVNKTVKNNCIMSQLLSKCLSFIIYNSRWGCLSAPHSCRDLFLFFNEVKYLKSDNGEIKQQ